MVNLSLHVHHAAPMELRFHRIIILSMILRCLVRWKVLLAQALKAAAVTRYRKVLAAFAADVIMC